MRDPSRIKPLLEKIEAVWINNSDLRLGQLLINLAPAEYRQDIFYMEDEELEAGLDKYIEDFIEKWSE